MTRRRGQRRKSVATGILVAIVAVWIPVAAIAGGAATIKEVYVVSRVGDSGIASDKSKRARRDIGVTLYAAIRVSDGEAERWFSDAGEIAIGRKRFKTEPMDRAPPHVVSWWRVEPAVETMSNTESGKFRFEPIAYKETAIASAVGVTQLEADVRPTLTTDRGHGVGTMRFQAQVIDAQGGVHKSPGAESRGGRGSGGLSDRVHRVSLRPDDTYIGFLSEMYGQPYIWASAGRTARSHQSERLEGSDCADFVTYGWRRLGHPVPYTWTGALPKYARRISGPGNPDADGVYRDKRGNALPFPERGDLLLFPRHVGVAIADRGAKGLLDEADIMFHTLFKSPEMEEIRATSFAGTPITVLRWRR